MSTGHVSVVVPAAGTGSRIGGIPKQFRVINGAPLIVHTLTALRRCEEVSSVVVALPEGVNTSGFAEQLGVHAAVRGGETRRVSVRQALKAVPAGADIVLIHDAVRPFVEARHISAVIAAVRLNGAASLGVPVVDTVRYASGDVFGSIVSRTNLFHVQTPQGFLRRILEEAIHTADPAETDEVACVQRLGYPVAVVRGSRNNRKVTVPEDWEWFARQWENPTPCE